MHKEIPIAILSSLKEGDRKAFKEVFDVLSDPVYHLAFRFLKDESWSEEIVQEVFLRLWLNKHKLDIHGNLWLYLYVISKRLCFNKLREIKKSKESLEKLLVHIERTNLYVENDIIALDLEEHISRKIAILPDRQKLVLTLSRYDGLSHKEISDKLGISVNTVKNHIASALKVLKEHIHKLHFLFYFLF